MLLIVYLILEFITEHKVQKCSQFSVSKPGLCFGVCHIITGMVEKGEDYIILTGKVVDGIGVRRLIVINSLLNFGIYNRT